MRDVEFPTWTRQYPSGLRVVAERDTRTPNVALVLVVGAGSADDPLGKEGLAHYVEHLAFRSRPDGKSSFWNLLERTGASDWNAFTDLDKTVYLEVGSKQTLGSLIQLEGQRMRDTVRQVSPDTFGVELDVVRNELRQRNETGFVGEVLGVMHGALFPAGHRYARPVGGTHASVSTLTADDVSAFVKKHYRPDNMTLEVIGNLELENIDNLILQSLPKELLEQPVSPPARRGPSITTNPPAPPSPAVRTAEAAVPTPELWIGWTLPSAFGANRANLGLARSIVNNALHYISSDDSDIAFTETHLIEGTEASILLCRVRLATGDHPEISAGHTLQKILDFNAPPTIPAHEYKRETEFVERKNTVAVEIMLEAESLIRRGIDRASMMHATGKGSDYARRPAEVAALERTDLMEFFATYLNKERARITLFRPRARSEELPAAIGFGADLVDDDKDQPILANAALLGRIAPGLGARAYPSMKLANGLEVIFADRPGLPVVSMELRFSSGLIDADDLGAAHAAAWTAHMQSNFYGNPAQFGAQFKRQFNDDSIRYLMTGAAGNTDIMLAEIAEIVNHIGIPAQSWQTFQQTQIPFLANIDRQPQAIAERAFFEALFPGSKHGRPFTMSLLAKTTSKSAEQWVTDTHVPNNAILVIAGEFDRDSIEPIVREHFGEWKKSAKPVIPIPAVIPSDKGATEPRLVVADRPGASQAIVTFGCVLPPAHKLAVDVRHDLGAALLDDRLRAIMREKGGVTYGFRTNAFMRRGGTAWLEMSGAVEQSKLVYSLAVLEKALKDLRQTPVDARDLARAKLRLARKHAARFMSNASIAGFVASYKTLGFQVSDVDDFAQFLGGITAEDIQADIKACFAGNPTLAIVGDAATARAAFKGVWQGSEMPEQ